MKLPDEVRGLLQKRFAGKHREWLDAGSTVLQWPLTIPLGVPSEAMAQQQVDAVRVWAGAWRDWRGDGSLQWVERRWRVLGTQRLPESLQLDGPRAVCAWIGELERWQRAEQRYRSLVGAWPQLAQTASRLFGTLADTDDADFERMMAVLSWLELNPSSGMYLRQLPIAGVDTKWIEQRKGLLARLVAGIRGMSSADEDFYRLCGLRQSPALVRIRILDPALRAALQGLDDLSAPLEQVAALELAPSTVLVVENLQSGLALPDLPSTVAFIGLGNRVDVLSRIPWIRGCKGIYWGDIDTHGYAILHRARQHFPQLRSVLMDEATLLQFSDLWTTEAEPYRAEELALLQPAERAMYQGLKEHRWRDRLRLEQERIAWNVAVAALQAMQSSA
jgi:hypothetical protein